MKIIEKSGYQALPWVRYITQSGGTFKLVLYFKKKKLLGKTFSLGKSVLTLAVSFQITS